MEKMPMSIIVPVSKDRQIRECLRSIDEEVEVVVVLNNQPSEEVIRIAEEDQRCRLIYVPGRGCNLAQVFNIGISKANYEKIVLTNSDCQFIPGLLRKMYLALDNYEVVKAQVDFDYNNYGQFMVAESRRLFHQVFDGGAKLFGPGLAFRKGIKNQIGSHFFDEQMQWGEDGELSKRIHQSNLSLRILEDKIRHAGENIRHDLQTAFKIGQGNRVKERRQGLNLGAAFLADLRHLLSDHHRQFRTAYRIGGLQLFSYFLLWKITFHFGYYTHHFGNKTTKNRKGTHDEQGRISEIAE